MFSGDMIRAILENQKSQTRRVVKAPVLAKVRPPDSVCLDDGGVWQFAWRGKTAGGFGLRCPCGAPGDRLWVREAWAVSQIGVPKKCGLPIFEYTHYSEHEPDRIEDGYEILYRATQAIDPDYPVRWRPSIHMPRWASRITLGVVGVRAERVQEITWSDIIREGVAQAYDEQQMDSEERTFAYKCWKECWNSINAKRGYPWSNNDWVWVVDFRRTA